MYLSLPLPRYSILSEDIHGIQTGNYTLSLQNAVNYSKQYSVSTLSTVRIPSMIPFTMYNQLITIIPSLASYISPSDNTALLQASSSSSTDHTMDTTTEPSLSTTTTVSTSGSKGTGSSSSSSSSGGLRSPVRSTINTSTTTIINPPPSTPIIHQSSTGHGTVTPSVSSSLSTPLPFTGSSSTTSGLSLGRSISDGSSGGGGGGSIGQPLLLQSIVNDPVTFTQYENLMNEWIKTKMLELFDALVKHRTRDLFMYPVTKDEAPDYFTIIQKPMDYTTLRSLIDKKEITTLEEFGKNIDLIITNCKLYNAPSTVGVPTGNNGSNSNYTTSNLSASGNILNSSTTGEDGSNVPLTSTSSNRKSKKKLENYYEWAVQLEIMWKPLYEKALESQSRERHRIITRLTASNITAQRSSGTVAARTGTTTAGTPVTTGSTSTTGTTTGLTTTGKKRARTLRNDDISTPGLRSGAESVVESELEDNSTTTTAAAPLTGTVTVTKGSTANLLTEEKINQKLNLSNDHIDHLSPPPEDGMGGSGPTESSTTVLAHHTPVVTSSGRGRGRGGRLSTVGGRNIPSSSGTTVTKEDDGEITPLDKSSVPVVVVPMNIPVTTEEHDNEPVDGSIIGRGGDDENEETSTLVTDATPNMTATKVRKSKKTISTGKSSDTNINIESTVTTPHEENDETSGTTMTTTGTVGRPVSRGRKSTTTSTVPSESVSTTTTTTATPGTIAAPHTAPNDKTVRKRKRSIHDGEEEDDTMNTVKCTTDDTSLLPTTEETSTTTATTTTVGRPAGRRSIASSKRSAPVADEEETVLPDSTLTTVQDISDAESSVNTTATPNTSTGGRGRRKSGVVVTTATTNTTVTPGSIVPNTSKILSGSSGTATPDMSSTAGGTTTPLQPPPSKKKK